MQNTCRQNAAATQSRGQLKNTDTDTDCQEKMTLFLSLSTTSFFVSSVCNPVNILPPPNFLNKKWKNIMLHDFPKTKVFPSLNG